LKNGKGGYGDISLFRGERQQKEENRGLYSSL